MSETQTAKHLREFLEYRAEVLIHKGERKPSSRPPAPYDKHLPDELVLRHLRHDPDLAKTFAGLADQFADRRVQEATLPPWADISTVDARFDANRQLARRAETEDAVRSYYMGSFVKHAARVASVLYLGSTVASWRPAIVIETDDNSSPRADLLLQWRDDDYDSYLEPDAKERASAARGFNSCITTFEFKSLTVAHEMPKLLRLVMEHRDTEFQWICCGSEHDLSKRSCKAHPPTSVLGVHAAFDALEPAKLISSSIRATLGVAEITPSHSHEFLPPPTDSRRSPRARRPSARCIESARTRIDMAEILSDPSSRASRANKVVEGKDRLHHPLDFLPRYILQQAWAEAVCHDVTYFLISTSNTEYLCVRHRQTQTLYVSDYINHRENNCPPLGKLHVGFFIAAMDDSIERAKLATERAENGLTVHIPNLGPVGLRLDKLSLCTENTTELNGQMHAGTSLDTLRGKGNTTINSCSEGDVGQSSVDTTAVSKHEAVSDSKGRRVRIPSAKGLRKKPISSISHRSKRRVVGGTKAEIRLVTGQQVQGGSQMRRTRSMR